MRKCLYIVKHGVEILDRKCINDAQKCRTVSGSSFGILKLANLCSERNMIAKFETLPVARFVERD